MKKPAKAAKPARKQPVKAAAPAAKHPQHPKHPQHKQPVSKAVHQARHATAVKAAKTRAANAKKAKAHPRRQLALGAGVACCSAEAVAASLRLAGHAVSDADVLALYWHTARDEHAGASIVATLEAAGEFGLAGVRPLDFREVMPCAIPGQHDYPAPGLRASRAGLILGLDLPGPHAVLDTGSEWVTWGEPWPAWAFPGAVIEEAWAVSW